MATKRSVASRSKGTSTVFDGGRLVMDSAFIGTDGGSSNVNGGIASERQQAALATKCKSIIYLFKTTDS